VKIYDCFPYFRERNLLELRFRLLWHFVDVFCIVEAGETHAGEIKDLTLHRFFLEKPAYLEKVRFIQIEKFDGINSDWGRENYQRNAIAGLVSDAGENDWVLISDLDEIPDPFSLLKLRDPAYLGNYSFLHFRQYFCYFRFNFVQVSIRDSATDPYWYGTVAMRPASRLSPQEAREMRWPGLCPSLSAAVVRSGGWHFSYLGGDEDFQIKLRSIAEHNLEKVVKARKHRVDELLSTRTCPFDPHKNVWAVVNPSELFSPAVVALLKTEAHYFYEPFDSVFEILERIRIRLRS
jgi:beta-1,4-mannosyl-glycoprotein beta-1,4-N-acetylglucosaminyltransferase